MTQPNPGNGGNATPNTQNQPQDPATGTIAEPTTPPAPPGFTPATGAPAAGGDDDQAAQMLAAAVQAEPGSDPNQLGDAGKRALDAERAARKTAEDAAKAQAKQLADLEKQLKALQPAADIFAQLRKAAVPDAEKTDTERLQEEMAKLRQETATERKQRWLLEVIQDKGLTRDDIEWLQGDSPEELAASADKLLARLARQVPPTTEAQPGEPAATQQSANGQPTQAAAMPSGPKPDPSQGARGPIDLNSQLQEAISKGEVQKSIAIRRQLAAAKSTTK